MGIEEALTENKRLKALHETGTSVWLDSLSREMLANGHLERMVRSCSVTGVTSNPTIFQQALAAGDAYDDAIAASAATSTEELFRELAAADVAAACDVLRPVWDRTRGDDGWVSLEVDPRLARNASATYEEAQLLKEMVDRPNVLIKIPATVPGLAAIEQTIAAGIPVNVTLIFSIERYAEVIDAYLNGLEKLAAADGDLSRMFSVASFFVSRVDTEADKRLESAGRQELAGKLGVANAKLAYQLWEQAFSGERWEALKAQGARPQKPLWASTGVKNPAYRDVLYVEELAGPSIVNTMPLATLEAFGDHGEAAPRIFADVDKAEQMFVAVSDIVDYDDVVTLLEQEGVDKFEHSFHELITGLEAKRAQLAAEA